MNSQRRDAKPQPPAASLSSSRRTSPGELGASPAAAGRPTAPHSSSSSKSSAAKSSTTAKHKSTNGPSGAQQQGASTPRSKSNGRSRGAATQLLPSLQAQQVDATKKVDKSDLAQGVVSQVFVPMSVRMPARRTTSGSGGGTLARLSEASGSAGGGGGGSRGTSLSGSESAAGTSAAQTRRTSLAAADASPNPATLPTAGGHHPGQGASLSSAHHHQSARTGNPSSCLSIVIHEEQGDGEGGLSTGGGEGRDGMVTSPFARSQQRHDGGGGAASPSRLLPVEEAVNRALAALEKAGSDDDGDALFPEQGSDGGRGAGAAAAAAQHVRSRQSSNGRRVEDPGLARVAHATASEGAAGPSTAADAPTEPSIRPEDAEERQQRRRRSSLGATTTTTATTATSNLPSRASGSTLVISPRESQADGPSSLPEAGATTRSATHDAAPSLEPDPDVVAPTTSSNDRTGVLVPKAASAAAARLKVHLQPQHPGGEPVPSLSPRLSEPGNAAASANGAGGPVSTPTGGGGHAQAAGRSPLSAANSPGGFAPQRSIKARAALVPTIRSRGRLPSMRRSLAGSVKWGGSDDEEGEEEGEPPERARDEGGEATPTTSAAAAPAGPAVWSPGGSSLAAAVGTPTRRVRALSEGGFAQASPVTSPTPPTAPRSPGLAGGSAAVTPRGGTPPGGAGPPPMLSKVVEEPTTSTPSTGSRGPAPEQQQAAAPAPQPQAPARLQFNVSAAFLSAWSSGASSGPAAPVAPAQRVWGRSVTATDHAAAGQAVAAADAAADGVGEGEGARRPRDFKRNVTFAS